MLIICSSTPLREINPVNAGCLDFYRQSLRWYKLTAAS